MYTLEDVPDTMRRLGWTVGEQAMRRWFALPTSAMDPGVKRGDLPPPRPFIDTGLVTLAWASRFTRAVVAFNTLRTTWTDADRMAAAQPQLEKKVKRWVARHGADPAKKFRFGQLHGSVIDVNEDSAININRVESDWYGTVDDFYAALGTALFKLAVAGDVAPAGGGRWTVTIDEYAIFLRDTYDFIGEQRLGSWGPAGFSRSAVLAPDIEIDPKAEEGWWHRQAQLFTVGNRDFRRYRDRFKRGGDYTLYSDLRHFRQDPPLVVAIGGL